ncbi:achaete-scute homolog 1a-like [Chrysoperla carnea]|uniref:achaete-scute homolog 1a-like n=1 Tax=Chrysoperla carnea TaxID=189513 RepID=UPI001D06A220|nr:achaete-scute homolog 1a-like [Chrysoperla carnea]
MAAVVQSLQQHPSMTLGNEANKMQQYKATNNCVIVTTNYNNHMQQKSVITTTAGKRPLAAATNIERTSVVVNNNSLNISNNNDMLRCKRKINFHMPYGTPGTHHQPASVARRNARERNRVKQVNNGFATLRQHIPASVAAALSSSSSSGSQNGRGASKKLSKVETLRMAVEYIRSLQAMIQQHESEMTGSHSSMNTVEQNEYYEVASPQSSKNNILTTPPCSESSSSPTPSYSSESSLSTPAVAYTQLNVYHPESYENYEPMSPEDEELLDVISWWQQQ